MDTSDEAFIRPGGNFPGGGARFFTVTRLPDGTVAPPGIGRNRFRGPTYFAVDMSVGKLTGLPRFLGLGEAAGLEFRANFFNVFNQRNLAPFGFSSDSTRIDRPATFGRATSGLSGRVIELQARFSF
jgi:hypothetical protein